MNGKEAFDKLVAAYEAAAPPHIAVIDMQARTHKPFHLFLAHALLSLCTRSYALCGTT